MPILYNHILYCFKARLTEPNDAVIIEPMVKQEEPVTQQERPVALPSLVISFCNEIT